MKYSKTRQQFGNANYGNVDTLLEAFNEDYVKVQNAMAGFLMVFDEDTATIHDYEGGTDDWVMSSDEAEKLFIQVGGHGGPVKILAPNEEIFFIVFNVFDGFAVTIDNINEDGAETVYPGEFAKIVIVEDDGATKLGSYFFNSSESSFAEILEAAKHEISSSGSLAGALYHASNLILHSSGGALEITLPDDPFNIVGRRVNLYIATAGNNAVVTITNFADGSTLTFDAVGESATLRWNGTAWELIALSGATIGT